LSALVEFAEVIDVVLILAGYDDIVAVYFAHDLFLILFEYIQVEWRKGDIKCY